LRSSLPTVAGCEKGKGESGEIIRVVRSRHCLSGGRRCHAELESFQQNDALFVNELDRVNLNTIGTYILLIRTILSCVVVVRTILLLLIE
jgi:hypothetical protein